jgi:hypothetical protein
MAKQHAQDFQIRFVDDQSMLVIGKFDYWLAHFTAVISVEFSAADILDRQVQLSVDFVGTELVCMGVTRFTLTVARRCPAKGRA